jgi:hypothetical protein
MRPHKRKPAAWRADRLPISFCSAAELSNHTQALLCFQATTVTRRFGVRPSTAPALAPLVFGEAAQ